MSENRYFGAVIAALAIAIVCACVPAGPKVRVINDGPEAVRVVVTDPLQVPKFDDSWVEVPAGGEVEVRMFFHYWRYDGRQRLLVSKDGDVLSVYEVAFYGHPPYSLLSEPYFVQFPAPVRISPETSLAWHDLKVTNNTSAPIRLIRDEFPLAVIPAGKTRAIELAVPLYEGRPVRLTAIPEGVALWRLSQGNIPFDRTFSHGELEAAGWHVVIPAWDSAKIAD